MKDLQGQCEIGLVGLGVMGANLVLNMADHDFGVAGFDTDLAKGKELLSQSGQRPVAVAQSPKELAALLKKPRAIMLMVPAGAIVDAAIANLLPFLETGDILIDGGNSFFQDTDRRAAELAKRGIQFLGVGVSGGSEGARHGPSIMPGGPEAAYRRVEPVLEAIAAKVNGEPCVTYLGGGSAGHYVKMVHNGIEYALMQLISEAYDLMKRGLGFSNDQLHDVYDRWNRGVLQSFLIEITANIFCQVDERTGKRLIDLIADQASQKGTGMWTSQGALGLHVPVPNIDIAVAMRDLSVFQAQRQAESRLLKGPPNRYDGNAEELVGHLEGALYAGMIITYAQGMSLLYSASRAYTYGLRLEEVARIWRGGCIIRSAVLEDIRAAYRARPDLPDLLLDDHLAHLVGECQDDLRRVAAAAAELGIPMPGFMTALAFLDAYRSEWLPANLIQAQRDYFGAHTYKRLDTGEVVHTQWNGA